MITRPTRFAVKPQRLVIILLAGILLLGITEAQDGNGRRMGRLAPSVLISCDHNQLTSWTGTVSGYKKLAETSWLEISTDSDTIEQVSIEHAGSEDASAYYLLWGEPFKPTDWKAIETAPGVLISGMRATAWICTDGVTPPVIDWQPGRH